MEMLHVWYASGLLMEMLHAWYASGLLMEMLYLSSTGWLPLVKCPIVYL